MEVVTNCVGVKLDLGDRFKTVKNHQHNNSITIIRNLYHYHNLLFMKEPSNRFHHHHCSHAHPEFRGISQKLSARKSSQIHDLQSKSFEPWSVHPVNFRLDSEYSIPIKDIKFHSSQCIRLTIPSFSVYIAIGESMYIVFLGIIIVKKVHFPWNGYNFNRRNY